MEFWCPSCDWRGGPGEVDRFLRCPDCGEVLTPKLDPPDPDPAQELQLTIELASILAPEWTKALMTVDSSDDASINDRIVDQARDLARKLLKPKEGAE